METFALYLFKSIICFSGFALVFILFLRNERFFYLNRIYLLAGIVSSFILPFVSIHYTVILPLVTNVQMVNAIGREIQLPGNHLVTLFKFCLILIYGLGVLVVLTLILRQGLLIIRSIKRSEIRFIGQAKLILTPEYSSAFSFFSYVFVNPSVTDIEAKEIMNHELVHVRQKHWLDLILIELLCVIQWFNPLVWIYVRFIRQNHEYLADEVALQRTSDPAVYRAALLNQIVGAPVVSLTNSFNYSVNKKRFNMMKNIISSPYRKMRVLLILPVIAVVLYSFAKPEYRYKSTDDNSGKLTTSALQSQNEVKGTVVMKDGSSLPGAIITIQNTTIGTIADDNGAFKIVNIPDGGTLIVSFVGFKSKVLKPDFKSMMRIEMVADTVKLPPSPPPPPRSLNSILSGDGPKPVCIVDGKLTTKADVEKIDPNSIESISVQETNTDTKGSKGNDKVVVIRLRKGINNEPKELPEVTPPPPPPPPPPVSGSIDVAPEKAPFVAMEELPEFIGGREAMASWIAANLKYPPEAFKDKIAGTVDVSFLVTTSGKIKNVIVSKSASSLLNTEAIRVISDMPDWKPGTQGGKSVPVQMLVPVEFILN